MTKKLYRSEDKMVCGVCAGIAEYFNVDPTVVRLAWVAITIAGGLGILPYIAAAIIIPMRENPDIIDME